MDLDRDAIELVAPPAVVAFGAAGEIVVVRRADVTAVVVRRVWDADMREAWQVRVHLGAHVWFAAELHHDADVADGRARELAEQLL